MRRIAVCFSGHIRNWEMAADNQKKFWEECFINNSEDSVVVDYFFHTWDESTERPTRNSNYIRRDLEKKEIENLLNTYKPKKYIIDSKKCDSFLHKDYQLAIFYGFQQSMKIKREYEIENNFEYDIVVKSRFDLVFHPLHHDRRLYLLNKIPMEIMSTFKGMMAEEYCLTNFNDIIFYGSSFVMDLASNLYFYRKQQFYKKPESIKYEWGFGPGVIMNLFFEEYGIQPTAIYTEPLHSKYGIFMKEIENIVRTDHSKIKDFNDPNEWPMVRKIQNEWFNN